MGYEIYKPEWGIQRPIRGVLFDMDGLVLDTEKLYSRFWREAVGAFGFEMTYAQSLRMRAVNSRLGEAILHELYGPGADFNKIRAKRIELMDAYVAEHGVEAKPGIFELLDYLEEHGIAAAITSSSPTDRIRAHLGSLGLYHRFARICSGHEVPRGKPAPDIYLHGAEDAPTGIRSAYDAGCLTAMIPDQDQPSAETTALLYAKADSLADIISLLETIRSI